MSNLLSFDDLMAGMGTDAVTSVGNGKEGFSGNFGINKAKIQVSYGPGKSKDGSSSDNQLTFIVKSGAGFKLSWISEPLYLTRKGVKNDALKQFTSKEFQDLLGRYKLGKASDDDKLFAATWQEQFVAIKSYLLNFCEAYHGEVGKNGKGENGLKLLAYMTKAGFSFDNLLKGFMSMFPKGTSEMKGHEKLGYMTKSPCTKTKELEIFLNYQWQFSKNQKKTYLDIPKGNKGTKQGLVFNSVMDEEYTVVEGEDAFKAINADGKVHPMERSTWFMSSNYGKQQSIDAEEDVFEVKDTEEETSEWGDFDVATTKAPEESTTEEESDMPWD